MSIEYEIIIIDRNNYCDVIIFESNGVFNDSNDIISEAIARGFMGENNRKSVWIARGYIEYE